MVFNKFGKVSYSQCGEDLIMAFLLNQIGLAGDIVYLDIGAHHPFLFSNTYYFYKRGSRGITVEPDASLHTEIDRRRPKDININSGVGSSNAKMKLFIFEPSTLNTFSKSERDRYTKIGHKLVGEQSVPVYTIDKILKESGIPGEVVNLVSLDVEGMDLEILKSIDFAKFRPELFCIETLEYTNKQPRKLKSIIKLMEKNGYYNYADTYINTIFVDKQKFKGAKS